MQRNPAHPLTPPGGYSLAAQLGRPQCAWAIRGTALPASTVPGLSWRSVESGLEPPARGMRNMG